MDASLSPSRRIVNLPILLLAAMSIAACDRPDRGSGRLEEKRCAQDGLCWKQVGKRSLEGGYRKGDDEIKFDAIFSPSRSFMTQFKDEWSYRLLDRRGLTFFRANSSNPPDSWIANPSSQEELWKACDEEQGYIKRRNDLASEMVQVMLQTERPQGQLRSPWDQLCRFLDGVFFDSGHAEAQAGAGSNEESEADFEIAQERTSQPEFAPGIGDEDVKPDSGEELLDDLEPHDEFAEGVTAKEQDDLGIDDGQGAAAQHESPPLSAFAFSQAKNKRTNPAEYGRLETHEFQQDLDLYSKHTRSFLAFGWKTGKHHSAACITLKRRPIGTSDAWEKVGFECTENHGTKAKTGEMKLYAICRDMPITKGFYVWKGECGGKFPTHYCNDDTALQIRHAHGIYDDGSKCLKRKRTHRPWCERPW